MKKSTIFQRFLRDYNFVLKRNDTKAYLQKKCFMLFAFCDVPLWIQILVFLVLSALCIIFINPISRRFLGVKHIATNADSLIGEEAVVVEEICNLEARGQVKVRGQIWTARSADKTQTYAKGDVLNVIAIEGVKLICKK